MKEPSVGMWMENIVVTHGLIWLFIGLYIFNDTISFFVFVFYSTKLCNCLL